MTLEGHLTDSSSDNWGDTALQGWCRCHRKFKREHLLPNAGLPGCAPNRVELVVFGFRELLAVIAEADQLVPVKGLKAASFEEPSRLEVLEERAEFPRIELDTEAALYPRNRRIECVLGDPKY
jgi:hypothetical protein